MSEISVISVRPEGVVLARQGAVVGIRRAPMHGPVLGELRRGIEQVAEAHPEGLVFLSVFRLSPRFPLVPGFDSNTRELADLLKVLDRTIAAIAQVHELDGVRAAAMRVATRTVLALARPRARIELFERVTDGVVWLLPHARRVGAPDDVASYLELYREADRALARMDEDELRAP